MLWHAPVLKCKLPVWFRSNSADQGPNPLSYSNSARGPYDLVSLHNALLSIHTCPPVRGVFFAASLLKRISKLSHYQNGPSNARASSLNLDQKPSCWCQNWVSEPVMQLEGKSLKERFVIVLEVQVIYSGLWSTVMKVSAINRHHHCR